MNWLSLSITYQFLITSHSNVFIWHSREWFQRCVWYAFIDGIKRKFVCTYLKLGGGTLVGYWHNNTALTTYLKILVSCKNKHLFWTFVSMEKLGFRWLRLCTRRIGSNMQPGSRSDLSIQASLVQWLIEASVSHGKRKECRNLSPNMQAISNL